MNKTYQKLTGDATSQEDLKEIMETVAEEIGEKPSLVKNNCNVLNEEFALTQFVDLYEKYDNVKAVTFEDTEEGKSVSVYFEQMIKEEVEPEGTKTEQAEPQNEAQPVTEGGGEGAESSDDDDNPF